MRIQNLLFDRVEGYVGKMELSPRVLAMKKCNCRFRAKADLTGMKMRDGTIAWVEEAEVSIVHEGRQILNFPDWTHYAVSDSDGNFSFWPPAGVRQQQMQTFNLQKRSASTNGEGFYIPTFSIFTTKHNI